MFDSFFVTLIGLGLILVVLAATVFVNFRHLMPGADAAFVYFERCPITIGYGGFLRLGGNLTRGQVGLTNNNIKIKMLGTLVLDYSDVKDAAIVHGLIRNFVRLRLGSMSGEVRVFSRQPEKLLAIIKAKRV